MNNEAVIFPLDMKPLLVVCVSKSHDSNKYSDWIIGKNNTPLLNKIQFVVLMDNKKITEVHKVVQPGAFTKTKRQGKSPFYEFKNSLDEEKTNFYKGKETAKRYFYGNQSFLEK